eukprot:1962277-Prymnesium_polylepis.1
MAPMEADIFIAKLTSTAQSKIAEISLTTQCYVTKEDPTPLSAKAQRPSWYCHVKSRGLSRPQRPRTSTQRARGGGACEGERTSAEEYYKFGDAIQRRLEKDLGGTVEKEYDIAKFRGIRPNESVKLDLSKPVVLYGKSGKAKTYFAMAQGRRPLLIDDPDKTKEITPQTEILVLDDMNFGPEGLNLFT